MRAFIVVVLAPILHLLPVRSPSVRNHLPTESATLVIVSKSARPHIRAYQFLGSLALDIADASGVQQPNQARDSDLKFFPN